MGGKHLKVFLFLNLYSGNADRPFAVVACGEGSQHAYQEELDCKNVQAVTGYGRLSMFSICIKKRASELLGIDSVYLRRAIRKWSKRRLYWLLQRLGVSTHTKLHVKLRDRQCWFSSSLRYLFSVSGNLGMSPMFIRLKSADARFLATPSILQERKRIFVFEHLQLPTVYTTSIPNTHVLWHRCTSVEAGTSASRRERAVLLRARARRC
jgi:hypothetical protein